VTGNCYRFPLGKPCCMLLLLLLLLLYLDKLGCLAYVHPELNNSEIWML
jgi:hypothetical protein